jgi:small-conductance mechanosensitive channel
MEKLENNTDKPWSRLHKLMPTLILLAVAFLAGGTDIFSRQVHEFVGKELQQRLADFTPYMFNTLFAAIWLNIGWLLYHRCVRAFDRIMITARVETDAAKLLSKGFGIFYWLVVLFLAIAFFAPSLIGWMAGAATLVTAALSVNFGGLLNDFVCGLFLQRWLHEGEHSKVNEISIAVGQVKSIGYVRTVIETQDDGPVSVRNSKLWDSTLAKPKKKLIIMPDDPVKDDATAASTKK